MRKITIFIVLTLLCLNVTSLVFAEATKKEALVIPKTGIVTELIDVADCVIAYRDNAVIAVTEKDTKISKNGHFLMTVHIMPSERKKNQDWFEYVNKVCAAFTVNNDRSPVSPVQVNEIVCKVSVNETNATWKIYGVKFYNISDKGNRLLYSASANNGRFTDLYTPLDKAPLFDAAYRKVIQWHKEH